MLSKGPMRGASIGGMPNVPQKLLMDQSIWLLYFFKKKLKEKL
jgi:hypothetical protein